MEQGTLLPKYAHMVIFGQWCHYYTSSTWLLRKKPLLSLMGKEQSIPSNLPMFGHIDFLGDLTYLKKLTEKHLEATKKIKWLQTDIG